MEIRWMNARKLAATESKQADFDDKVGIDYARSSQLIGVHPHRNIGNWTARKIEKAYRKPHGWLDTVHNGDDLTPEQREWLSFYDQLAIEERNVLIDMFRRAIKSETIEKIESIEIVNDDKAPELGELPPLKFL